MGNSVCLNAVTQYTHLLQKQIVVIQEAEGCRLTVPFYRPDGEAIELVVSQTMDGKIKVSDEYTTSDYLFVHGFCLENNKDYFHQARVLSELRNVSFESSEIYTIVDEADVGMAIEKTIDAIQAVTYLIYKRTHKQRRPFVDEVALFLVDQGYTIATNQQLQGQVTKHSFPLFVNSSINTAINPFSTTSNSIALKEAKALGYSVADVKAFDPRIKVFVITDDRKPANTVPWQQENVKAILASSVDMVTNWNLRHKLLQNLVTV